jgi:putative FmdB family regulatory protein
MPIYEYECLKCRSHHEIMQKITEGPRAECPDCGGRLKKMMSNTSFVLKGTGWYATDYASAGKKAEHKETATTKEKAGEAKAGEKKTDTKSETKADTGKSAAAK